MLALFERLLHFFSSLILGISTGQNFPPPLPRSEENALFRRLALDNDQEARAKLIEHNLRLVAHIVRKYYTSSPNTDELISIGSIGLIKAIDSFKSDNGARFATYGAKCIQNEILMYFRSQKKQTAEVSLSETIDVDRDGNPLTYIDIVSDDCDIPGDLDKKLSSERIRRLIERSLDDREKEIICLRYGLSTLAPKTQREVAKKLGISRSYVSRIEKKALGILRHELEEHEKNDMHE